MLEQMCFDILYAIKNVESESLRTRLWKICARCVQVLLLLLRKLCTTEN